MLANQPMGTVLFPIADTLQLPIELTQGRVQVAEIRKLNIGPFPAGNDFVAYSDPVTDDLAVVIAKLRKALWVVVVCKGAHFLKAALFDGKAAGLKTFGDNRNVMRGSREATLAAIKPYVAKSFAFDPKEQVWGECEFTELEQ